MTGLADVDRFIICIQICVLSGFRPLCIGFQNKDKGAIKSSANTTGIKFPLPPPPTPRNFYGKVTGLSKIL